MATRKTRPTPVPVVKNCIVRFNYTGHQISQGQRYEIPTVGFYCTTCANKESITYRHPKTGAIIGGVAADMLDARLAQSVKHVLETKGYVAEIIEVEISTKRWIDAAPYINI